MAAAFLSRLRPPRMGRDVRAVGVLDSWTPCVDIEAGQTTDMGGPAAGSSSAKGGSSKESSDLPGEPGVVDESAVFAMAAGANGFRSGGPKGASPSERARPGCITGAVVVAGVGGPCGFLGPPRCPKDISTAAFKRHSLSGLLPVSWSSRGTLPAPFATICRLFRRSSRATMLVPLHLKQSPHNTRPQDRQWYRRTVTEKSTLQLLQRGAK